MTVDMAPLYARIDRDTFHEPNSGCWLWGGADHGSGYGHVRFNMRALFVHRVSYERHVGPIPDGMHIDHKCRNRGCLNPDHLEPVTPRENTRRGLVTKNVDGKCHRCGSALEPIRLLKTARPSMGCRGCEIEAGRKRYADNVEVLREKSRIRMRKLHASRKQGGTSP